MAPRALPLLPLTLLATSLLACADDPPLEGPPQVTTGSYTAFVQRGWTMPATATEAREIGFDLDHDGSRDNLIGMLVGALAGYGLEVDDANAALLGTGDPILAHVVRADRRDDDPSVAWQLWRSAGAPLRFDGTDRIGESAIDGELWGAITASSLAARWGDVAVPVPLFPGQPPILLALTDAQLELAVDGPCRGLVGGTVNDAALTTALDEVGRQTVAHMQAHPRHEFTEAAVTLMDSDSDRAVTVAEVATFARRLLAPDVDLDDDGLADGVSFALGFECAAAQLAIAPTF